MAAEPEQNVEEAKSPKLKWLLIGGGALLLIAIIVVVVIFLTRGSSGETSATSSAGFADIEEDNLGEAFYVALPRNFIFNAPGAQRDRVVQITVQLMVRGPRNERLAQENIPLIEAELLDVFSRAMAERLNTPEGKREIRVQALDALRTKMREATEGSPVVEEVLFTGFVIQ